jgi:hypothetical protein
LESPNVFGNILHPHGVVRMVTDVILRRL